MKKKAFPLIDRAAADASTTIGFLQQHYPNLSISVDELSTLTGERPQTIRNAVSQGKYPIPSFRSGPRRRFLLTEVAKYVEKEHALSATCLLRPAKEFDHPPAGDSRQPGTTATTGALATGKRRRGRPTKVEQMARRQTDV